MSPTGTRLLSPSDAAALLLTPDPGASWHDFLQQVTALADASYAGRGWDQPYQLLALSPFASLPKKRRERLAAAHQSQGGPRIDLAAAYAVGQVPIVGEGSPHDLLGGARVPDWVRALIFTTEAFGAPAPAGQDDPTAGLRPSQHPGRFDLRMTTTVTGDGHLLSLLTPRDGTGVLREGDAAARPYGALVDTLLRLLGAPTPPSAYHPGHLLAAWALMDLTERATRARHAPGTPGVRSQVHEMAREADQYTPLPVRVGSTQVAHSTVPQLLTEALVAADHPGVARPNLYVPASWDDAAALWARIATQYPDDAWRDAGTFARALFADVAGGATSEDLLSTIAAIYGQADADLLRAGLGALGVLDWPQADLFGPEPVPLPAGTAPRPR